ncbi:MAG: hypothetical protein HFJ25_04130 [Clostridia bacterium]|jgi:hypothetical protein|nr:hypothetical protein [Clostridia bacterium]
MDFTKDIYINKDIIHEDSEIVILYKGFLFSNNLTNELYISYGYGDLWDNKSEIKMKPSTFGYLATIKIESGKNLQFCFRNNKGIWDNNEGENYILPITETTTEDLLSFTPIEKTVKEVNIEVSSPELEPKSETIQELFKPQIISSSTVDLYQTVDLENISKQAIPNNTIVTQIKLDEKQNIVSKSIIQSEIPDESIYEEFNKITEKAKANSVKAFDDNQVTAGSIYVNSIVKEIPNIETKNENYLIPQEEKSLSGTLSFIGSLFKNVKTAFSKLTTLIKSAFNLNNEDN